MNDINSTIESINNWIRRNISRDTVPDITPEMIKALAELTKVRNSQRRKRNLFRFLKKYDWFNLDFWFGAFTSAAIIMILTTCASLFIKITGCTV